MRFLSTSEDEREENDQNIETSVDGTVLRRIQQGSGPGKSPLYTIFREISELTGYAKRNIMKGKRGHTPLSILLEDSGMLLIQERITGPGKPQPQHPP
ncbi:hypothetical protein AVEN_262672-1 [Araneus ventricosus]|uniref:Uncharacterized protein n=1 Tax=Araneus ventricosus TaxID=182803 RepID=A0A4Y2WX09_ARAVE|nr:hypothetical protein AVEN_262672-1 [Araneus ventricosus]